MQTGETRKGEDQLRKERMVEDICNNRSREFFKEVKKSYPKCGIAPSIDDQVESGVIANNFANNYDDLYNSVPSDIDRLQGIYAEIHEKCKFSTDEDRKVTYDDIKETLRYIKSRKADGDKGLISDHLLLASDIFLQQLALMLTSILTHGYQPKDILLGTITSIPKTVEATFVAVKTTEESRGVARIFGGGCREEGGGVPRSPQRS